MALQPYAELAWLLGLTALAGLLATRLRQPMIIVYMVVGVLVGPAVFGIVRAHDQIDLLAQIGVSVLLFTVGLKLDVTEVRQIGPVALATGLGQLAFTIVFGLLLLLALGKPPVEALYVAVALTFSSTIIIVKLLADKRELDSLHGRIAVGFLIVQDIAVVLAMMLMSAWGGTDGGGVAGHVAAMALRLVGAAALLFVTMRFVLPRLTDALARSQELLLVFALAWGTGLASLGEWAGFSKEAGAFLAGFSLASTRYREAISGRLSGLRDFLLLFFFIDLGARMDFATLTDELGTAVVLSLFVLVGNPLIVMAIMGWMGYRRRTGFLAGLTVAQISEFSIVFVSMGIALGHVGSAALGLTTVVGVITITLSTYMILYSHRLYEWFRPLLGPFERRSPARELGGTVATVAGAAPPAVVVVGLGRYGARLLRQLGALGIATMGVDFDPEAVRRLQGEGLPVRFGDAEDLELLDALVATRTGLIVLTLPDEAVVRTLLAGLRDAGFAGRVGVAARDDSQIPLLRTLGVEVVLRPFEDAADRAAALIAGEVAPKESK